MAVNFVVGFVPYRLDRDVIAINHRQSRRLTLPHLQRGRMKTRLSRAKVRRGGQGLILHLHPSRRNHRGTRREKTIMPGKAALLSRGTRRYIIMRIYALDVAHVCVARVCGWCRKKEDKVVSRERA